MMYYTDSDGIKPPPDVETVPLKDILPELKTGDIILTSGATSFGAIIKFFDDSNFSHVALVSHFSCACVQLHHNNVYVCVSGGSVEVFTHCVHL